MTSLYSAILAPSRPAVGPVRVLIVDDSAVTRRLLSEAIGRDPDIHVIGTAADPYMARNKIVELQPDVITLDLAMPRMDGITFLRHLMQYRPMPVIVVSSLSAEGIDLAVEAMAAGALDVVRKPSTPDDVQKLYGALAVKIKQAGKARVRGADAHLGASLSAPFHPSTAAKGSIIALGASTGGVQALTGILAAFPADAPATLVVQHMPAGFTASFASRLNTLCQVEVKEAADGDALRPGRVLVAPGGKHMCVRRSRNALEAEITDGPEICHQRPSVDVLFNSLAQHAGANVTAALLTGMGNDGARALLNLRRAGARTIAQDEASCAVFGMPAEAIRLGAAEAVVPLQNIAGKLLQLAQV